MEESPPAQRIVSGPVGSVFLSELDMTLFTSGQSAMSSCLSGSPRSGIGGRFLKSAMRLVLYAYIDMQGELSTLCCEMWLLTLSTVGGPQYDKSTMVLPHVAMV